MEKIVITKSQLIDFYIQQKAKAILSPLFSSENSTITVTKEDVDAYISDDDYKGWIGIQSHVHVHAHVPCVCRYTSYPS